MGNSGGSGLAGRQSEPGNDGQECAPVERAGNAWSDSEWLWCSDGKWRRTQRGVRPLAPRVSGRVGQLRAYGNAIVPQVAAEFVRIVCH
jgi:DNA (cytosine-5)-methyltransferase 1